MVDGSGRIGAPRGVIAESAEHLTVAARRELKEGVGYLEATGDSAFKPARQTKR